MQQAFVEVYGVPTKVITYGRWIEESPSKEPEDIVLCIPGNPGVTQFYCTFMQTIHERLGYSVWILSHAGHELPKNNFQKAPVLTDNERLYALKGQVNHKISFIEKYVPKNAKIHFIGHSIGAYIILQLLKIPSINSRAAGNYLLFPTIEYMAETPNGKLLTKVVRHIVWLIVFLAWIFTLLPSLLQTCLIQIYMTVYSVEKEHRKNIVDFVGPDALAKVFCMALDEMNVVRERDSDVLVQNKSKIRLYYAATDRWAPKSYCERLLKEIPGIDAQICTRNFEHAFVLRHSKEVGAMVANWIEN